VSATLWGSSGSTGVGEFDVTLQNRQFRVQLAPKIMNVAVCFEKHSNMLGQAASWQTV
jgi:hypothetical protein